MKSVDEEGYMFLYQDLVIGTGYSAESVTELINFEMVSTVDFEEEEVIGKIQDRTTHLEIDGDLFGEFETNLVTSDPIPFQLKMNQEQLYMISYVNGYLQYDLLEDKEDNLEFDDYVMDEYSIPLSNLSNNFEEVDDYIYRITVDATDVFDPDDFEDNEEISDAFGFLETIDLIVTFNEELNKVKIEIDEFVKIGDQDKYISLKSTMIQEGIDEMRSFDYDNDSLIATNKKEDFGFPIDDELEHTILFVGGMNYIGYFLEEGEYDLDYNISTTYTMALIDQDGDLIVMDKDYKFLIEEAQIVYFTVRIPDENAYQVSTIMSVKK
jgi:hypothetical protein